LVDARISRRAKLNRKKMLNAAARGNGNEESFFR